MFAVQRHFLLPSTSRRACARTRGRRPDEHDVVPAISATSGRALMAEAEAEADSRPVEGRIISKLQAVFSPKHLEVLNESASHNVSRGSETHFKVIVVSDGFAGVGPLDRHRLVNGALADELAGCVRFAIPPTIQPLTLVPPGVSHPRLAGVCTRYQSWPRLRRSGLRRARFRRRHHASVGAIGDRIERALHGLKSLKVFSTV